MKRTVAPPSGQKSTHSNGWSPEAAQRCLFAARATWETHSDHEMPPSTPGSRELYCWERFPAQSRLPVLFFYDEIGPGRFGGHD